MHHITHHAPLRTNKIHTHSPLQTHLTLNNNNLAKHTYTRQNTLFLAPSLATLLASTSTHCHCYTLPDLPSGTANSTHSLACLPARPLIHSLTHSLTHSPTFSPFSLALITSPPLALPRLPLAIAPPDSNPDTCKTTHKHAFLSPRLARHLFHLIFLASGSLAPNLPTEPGIVCVCGGGGRAWCYCCWWSGVLRDHPDHPNGLFGPVLAPFGRVTPLALAFASLGGFTVNPRSLILLLKPSQS